MIASSHCQKGEPTKKYQSREEQHETGLQAKSNVRQQEEADGQRERSKALIDARGSDGKKMSM